MKAQSKFLKIITIALPIAIQGIVFDLQSLTDKAFLGNLGTNYISALGAAQFPFCALLDAVLALGTGVVIFTAQLIGAKKEEKVNDYVLSYALYGSFLTTALFLMWMFFAEPILLFLNVDRAILSDSALYIRICSGVLLLLGIDCALQSMLQGVGNTKPIMVCSLMKVVLNIIISYILIFGVFGLPKMNIMGAAIGTLAANVISSLSIMFYCLIYKRKEYHLLKDLKACIKFRFFKSVIRIGLPTAFEYFSWNASNLVLIAFLNGINLTATAVYTLTCSIEGLLFSLFNGIGKSSMTLIGQDIGAEDYKSAAGYMKFSILINCVLVVLAILASIFLGTYILGIFTTDQSFIKTTFPFLVFTAAITFPKSMNVIIGNSIRAYGNTKWMLFSQFIGSIFVVTCSYILVKVAGLGIEAIYITVISDESLRAIINGIYYKKNYSMGAKGAAKSKLSEVM